MALFQSGNPALSEKRFKDTVLDDVVYSSNTMTVRGYTEQVWYFVYFDDEYGFYAWKEFEGGGNVQTLWMIGAIGGLVVAIILMFKQEWAPFLAPAYALLEGLFIGAVSATYNYVFAEKAPYIIMQAVGLTMGVCIAMYLLYSFKIIQATQKFKAIVITATAGIGIFYMIAFALSFFGVSIPFLHEGSTFGIIFSLVVGLAAMNLIIDFDMVETGSAMGAPKYMEWYGAFGLMVTVVWLYIEVLRLLSKLNKR